MQRYRNPSHWRFARLIFALAAVILLSSVAFFAHASIVPSTRTSMARAALAYGKDQMVWIKGPAVVSTRVIRLRNLGKDLRAEVAPTVWRDVNVLALLHQYGPGKRVGLVILRGVFNSLPPDEGVVVHADVVVLVDVRTNRGIYLMD